jgi:transcriptional regulator with XRE-family HTH domain
MAKTQSICFHRPINDRTTRLARSKAVPQVLFWTYDETRRAVGVKRTMRNEVFAVSPQLDAPSFYQPLQRHLALDALELINGNAIMSHPRNPQKVLPSWTLDSLTSLLAVRQVIMLGKTPSMQGLDRQSLACKLETGGRTSLDAGVCVLMATKEEGFAKRLRELRQGKNWSQSDLAQEVGLHYNHLGRFERGSSRPSADTLKKLADALGVSTDYLLDGAHADAAVADFGDRELLRLFQEVQELDNEDKDVVKRLIDAFVTKKKLKNLAQ